MMRPRVLQTRQDGLTNKRVEDGDFFEDGNNLQQGRSEHLRQCVLVTKIKDDAAVSSADVKREERRKRWAACRED
jgi:hypothetical protein